MLLVVPTNIKKHQEGLCFNLLQVISFNKVKEISLHNTHHVVPKVHSIIILTDGSMKFLIFMRYESFGIRYGGEHFREESHFVWGDSPMAECWFVLLPASQEEREKRICQLNKQIKMQLTSLMVLSNLN